MDDEAGGHASRGGEGGRLLFGTFALDPARRLLQEGTGEIPIGSRAMDLLLLLVERQGGLVTPDELIARAWPGVMVENVNLRVHISALRRALRDGAGRARVIVTVPGRGYRFLPPIRREIAKAAPVGFASTLPALPHAGAIGRQEVIERALARLPQQRLLTIVGPGGIGKTTLAIAIAHALGEGCADGVCWVDLGGLGRGDSVATSVALAIGLASFTQDPTPGIVAWLRGRRMLLVLDCCERVVAAAAAMVERILRETTGVQVLATSREALRATGEHVLRLPPLAIPTEGVPLTAGEAGAYAAVRLFTERAAAVLGGFTLRDEDVAPVVRICTRLDGIALAIELAAGHLVAFDLRSLATMLEDRFRLLPMGRRTSVSRHQTMHTALAWSYDVLSENERRVLRHLALFEGSADLDALRPLLDGITAPELVASLAGLTDKSLVVAESDAAGLRYRLLDTTRVFALERLQASGELDHASGRHAAHMLVRLQGLQAQGADEWLVTRRGALPDMRAALAWALATPGEDTLAIALAAEAVALFYGLSLADECRRRGTEALARMERAGIADARITMRLRASLAAASLYTPGPDDRHLVLWESVLALAAGLDDAEYTTAALFGLLSARMHRDETGQALDATSRLRAVASSTGDEAGELVSDRMTAIALHLRGEHAAARVTLERMIARYDAEIHGWGNLGFRVDHRLMARATLARVLWVQGEVEKAMRLCAGCVEALLAQDHAIALCYALFEIAVPLHCMVGDMHAARREARRLQDAAERHGLAIFQAGAGWLMLVLDALQGGADASACRRAADALLACGYTAQRAWLSAMMAEAALRRRDAAAGLDWIAAPLALCEVNRNGWWWPELLRLRAELTACAGGPPADVAADLERAAALARAAGALSLELRIASSRMRLRNMEASATAALADVLARFREGFGTADLAAARTLLARSDG